MLAANLRLLTAIAEGDWTTYTELCDPTLTAFEPESRGHLIEGLPFHQFYFDLGGIQGPHNTTMSSPHVRLLPGDVAVLSYVRLVQKLAGDGSPMVTGAEETARLAAASRPLAACAFPPHANCLIAPHKKSPD